jgi:ABC-type Fe3+-hydroxamate transport system substrate-binding protein
VKRRAVVSSLGALLFSAGAAVFAGKLISKGKTRGTGQPRLVSLAPALTETVLALDAARQLVAVSNYCILPHDMQLPRVGTSLTPSYEAIAGLHCSRILCDDSAGTKRAELSALAPCEFLPWLTLSEVVSSTRRLGQVLGREAAAAALADKLQTRLSRQPPANAPRVLLLLSYDANRPAEIWFIRQNSLHGAALNAAGARNAVEQDVPGLPRLGLERLLELDPDMVLIIPPRGTTPQRELELVQAFSALAPLRAVKTGRIKCVAGTQSVGPSILQLVDAIEAAL